MPEKKLRYFVDYQYSVRLQCSKTLSEWEFRPVAGNQLRTSACSCPIHSLITVSMVATSDGMVCRDSNCLALASTSRISWRMDLMPIESMVDFNLCAVLPTCSQFSSCIAFFRSCT